MAPPPLPELQNFTKIADVFICVKILECWGKKCRRPNRFVKLSSFGVKSTNFVLSSNHFQPLPPDLKCKFYISIHFNLRLNFFLGVKFGLKYLSWHWPCFLPPTPYPPLATAIRLSQFACFSWSKIWFKGFVPTFFLVDILKLCSLPPSHTRHWPLPPIVHSTAIAWEPFWIAFSSPARISLPPSYS